MAGERSVRYGWLLAGAILLFVLLVAKELILGDDPVTQATVLLELLDVSLLVGCSALLVLRLREQEKESSLLRHDVDIIRADGQRWRDEMAQQLFELGAAIRRQLEAWGLTAAEQEVGLMLLKGLSLKEIARARGTSEATTRGNRTLPQGRAGGDQWRLLLEKARLAGQHPNIVIGVDDIQAAMRQVTEAGGKVLGEPLEIPGVGQYVSFFVTEGNRVSMLQPLPRN